MADPDVTGLAYGQFGECIYDPEASTWTWNRHVRPTPQWRRVGSVSHIEQSQQQEPDRPYTADCKSNTLETYVHRRLDLAPAVSILRDSVVKGDASSGNAASPQDAVIGQRLALLHISSRISRRNPQVLVSCRGAMYKTLHLALIRTERQGWHRDKYNTLKVPYLANDTLTWAAPSTILQVLAADHIDGQPALLAVRTRYDVIVLRPAFKSELCVSQRGGQPSRLHCQTCTTLRSPSGAGTSLSDVAFNPWFQSQVGVIDQYGKWTVFDLALTRQDARWKHRAHAGFNGQVVQNDKSLPKGGSNDGWGRIIWVGGPGTIAVCSRASLALVDLRESATMLDTPSLDIAHDHCLLDLCRDPLHPEFFYVLTSANIFQLKVTTKAADRTTVGIVSKIVHFRNAADMKISMSAFALDQEVIVAVNSASAKSTTLHSFHFDDHLPYDATVADPTYLPLATSTQSFSMISIHWAPTEHLHAPDNQSFLTRLYKDNHCKFYMVMMLSEDGTLTQQMICRISADVSRLISKYLVTPHWQSKRYRSTRVITRDAFVVDDFEENENDVARLQAMYKRRDSTANLSSAVSSKQGVQTLNLEMLYARINHSMQIDREDFATVIDRARHVLVSNISAEPMQLLAACTTRHIQVADLEESDLGVQHLLDGATQNEAENNIDRLIVSPISPTRALGLQPLCGGPLTLETLYQSLKTHYVTPLNPQVPARTRLAKELLARHVAADVFLSSLYLRRPFVPEVNFDEDLASNAGSSQISRPADSQIASQSSRSVRASSVATTQSSFSMPDTNPVKEAIDALQKYTTITLPKPLAGPTTPSQSSAVPSSSATPADSLPHTVPGPDSTPSVTTSASVKRVLDHWAANTSLESYNWSEISARQAKAADLTSLNLSDRQRERLIRKARRHEERRRREDLIAKSQSQELRAPVIQSSQINNDRVLRSAVKGSSQDVGRRDGIGGLDGSQSGFASASASGFGIASQVEPGRYGGRLAVELPKRKRRAEGF